MSSRRIFLFALGAVLALNLSPAHASAGVGDEASFTVPGVARVSGCRTGELGGGQIVLSPYGSNVVRVTNRCRVEVTALEGPISVWNPTGPVAGLGVVYGIPRRYDARGRVRLDGLPLLTRLRARYADGVVDSYFHHEVVRTKWGTYLSIFAIKAADGAMDDIVVEFDRRLRILRTLDLNQLLFGERWGARDLGAPFGGEHWLHTNSLDTNAAGQVLVSLRNINRVALVDWQRGEIVRTYGKGVLSLQHYARFTKSGTITVYDNGAVKRRSGIAVFGAKGKLRRYLRLPFYGSAYGSVQQLPNRRWLVLNGPAGVVYVLDRKARKAIFKIEYLAKDWIPFHRKYASILYRAQWVR